MLQDKSTYLQDTFLNRARRGRVNVTVFLVNGYQLHGIITAFDSFTLVLISEGRQQLIYKHAVSTIVPAAALTLSPERQRTENVSGKGFSCEEVISP